MYGSNILCEFNVDANSVLATGSYTNPFLRMQSEAMRFNYIDYESKEYHYSVISHELGFYVYKAGGSYPEFISSVIIEGIPIHSWWKNSGRMTFIATLDYFKMLKIEECRQGGDIRLGIKGEVQIAIQDFKESKQAGSYKTPVAIIVGYTAGELELTYDVKQSHWVNKVLSSLGHRKFHLIELDLADCHISEALEFIKQMENDYNSANYISVGTRAKSLVDFLSNKYLHFTKEDYKSKKWEKASAMVNSLAMLKDFSSITGHEQEMGLKFNRIDAEYTLIHAKALIRYAQQLKQQE